MWRENIRGEVAEGEGGGGGENIDRERQGSQDSEERGGEARRGEARGE